MKKFYLLLTALVLFSVGSFAQNNDDCDDAFRICAGNYNKPFVRTTLGKTSDGLGTCAPAENSSVWFFVDTYVSGGQATITIAGFSGFCGMNAEVFSTTRTDCDSLTSVDCDFAAAPPLTLTIPATAPNTRYYIMVNTPAPCVGETFSITISNDDPDALMSPPNASFADSFYISDLGNFRDTTFNISPGPIGKIDQFSISTCDTLFLKLMNTSVEHGGNVKYYWDLGSGFADTIHPPGPLSGYEPITDITAQLTGLIQLPPSDTVGSQPNTDTTGALHDLLFPPCRPYNIRMKACNECLDDISFGPGDGSGVGCEDANIFQKTVNAVKVNPTVAKVPVTSCVCSPQYFTLTAAPAPNNRVAHYFNRFEFMVWQKPDIGVPCGKPSSCAFDTTIFIVIKDTFVSPTDTFAGIIPADTIKFYESYFTLPDTLFTDSCKTIILVDTTFFTPYLDLGSNTAKIDSYQVNGSGPYFPFFTATNDTFFTFLELFGSDSFCVNRKLACPDTIRNMWILEPPILVYSPDTVEFCLDEPFTFCIDSIVDGVAPFTYTWYYNAVDVDSVISGGGGVAGGPGPSTFYNEDFGAAACPGGTSPAVEGWTITSTGANGAVANTWFVSAEEDGLSAGSCGTACNTTDRSLHVGNVAVPPILGADNGAAYFDDGGFFGGSNTDKRVESPCINTTGIASAITLSFNYIAGGVPGEDETELFYTTDAWATPISLGMMTPTVLCGIQGTWTAFSISDPAFNGNACLQLGFRWKNNIVGAPAADPSFAVDDIMLDSVAIAPPPVAIADSCITKDSIMNEVDLYAFHKKYLPNSPYDPFNQPQGTFQIIVQVEDSRGCIGFDTTILELCKPVIDTLMITSTPIATCIDDANEQTALLACPPPALDSFPLITNCTMCDTSKPIKAFCHGDSINLGFKIRTCNQMKLEWFEFSPPGTFTSIDNSVYTRPASWDANDSVPTDSITIPTLDVDSVVWLQDWSKKADFILALVVTDSSGCKDTSYLCVPIHEPPTITRLPGCVIDTPVKDTLIVIGACAGSTYIWDLTIPSSLPGDSFVTLRNLASGVNVPLGSSIVDADTVEVTYNTAKVLLDSLNYTFQLIVTDGVTGCIDTVLLPVVLDTPIVASITPGDTVICKGECVRYRVTVSAIPDSAKWFIVGGGLIPDSAASLTVCPTDTTSYELVVYNGGCEIRDTVTVFVDSLPIAIANVSPNDSLCVCDTVTLDGTGSTVGAGIVYLWSSDSGNVIIRPDSIIARAVVCKSDTFRFRVSNTTDPDTCKKDTFAAVVAVPIPPTFADAFNKFNGEDSVCMNPGDTITLNGDTTGLGLSATFEWELNGVHYSDSLDTILVTTSATVYPAIFCLTITNAFGCDSTMCDTIYQYPLPCIVSDADTFGLCGVSGLCASSIVTLDTVTFCINGVRDTVKASYHWFNDGGNNIIGLNGDTGIIISDTINNCISIVFDTEDSGAFIIQVSVFDSIKGCTDTLTHTFTILDSIDLAVSPKIDTLCLGIIDTLVATGAVTYSWTIFPATGSIPCIGDANCDSVEVSATATGLYDIVVTGGVGSCTDTVRATVLVNPLPSAFAGTDTTICLNSPPIALGGEPTRGGNPTATGGSGSGYVYDWSPTPLFGVTDIEHPLFNPALSGAGTFKYFVSVSDDQGCASATDSIIITVDSLPIVNAGTDTSVCSNVTIDLNGTASGTGTLTYIWTATNGSVSPASGGPLGSPAAIVGTYTPTIQGVDVVILTVTNSNGCISFDTVLVRVDTIPTANAGVVSDTICIGSSITLGGAGCTTASGGKPPYTYAWSPSPLCGVTDICNPVFTPTAPACIQGVYIFNVIVTDSNGCVSIPATTTIQVDTFPLVSVSATDTPLCLGNELSTLVGTTTYASSFIWTDDLSGTFLPDATSTLIITSWTAGDTGTATITLTANSDVCGSASASISFPVKDTPTVNITTANDSICITTTKPLVATATNAASVLWTLGAGSAGGSFSPADSLSTVFTPSGCGNNTIIITATGISDCPPASDTMILNVQCMPTDTIFPLADDTSCVGECVDITGDTTNAQSFVWSVVPAGTLTGASTLTPQWCPPAGFNSPPPVIITLTARNTKCGDVIATRTFTVVDSPIIDVDSVLLAKRDTICLGSSYTVKGKCANCASFAWSSIPSLTFVPPNSSTTTVTPALAGEYTITLDGAPMGSCPTLETFDTLRLVVLDTTIDLTVTVVNSPLCEGETATIIITSATNYTGNLDWDENCSGALTDVSNDSAHYVGTVQESCTVTITADNSNCPNPTSKSVTITVDTIPDVKLIADKYIGCGGDLVTLTATGGGIYDWLGIDTTGTIVLDTKGLLQDTLIVSPQIKTLYCVTGHNSGLADCIDSACVLIDATPNPIPLFDLGVKDGICYPLDAEFTYLGSVVGLDSLKWTFGDGDSILVTSGFLTPIKHYFIVDDSVKNIKVTYQVNLHAYYSNDCDRDTTIERTSCVDFYIPNVFTPDGDGVNDRFVIRGIYDKNCDMSIFNRWGEKIWEGKYPLSPEPGWDGYDKDGHLVNADTYYYILKCGGSTYTGWVKVIRPQ